MKEKQYKKISMYQSVIDLMHKENAKLKKIKELNKTYELLVSHNNKLTDLKIESEKDIQTEVDKKNVARDKILKIVSPIANILQVYAMDFKDKALKKKIDFSINKLDKAKDSKLVQRCDLVWKKAKQIYGSSLFEHGSATKQKTSLNISGYGITGQMIDDLENANKYLIECILHLKNGIVQKAKNKKKIKSKMQTIDNILKSKVDKLMTIFQYTEQDLYNAYKKSRKIEKKKTVKSKSSKKKTDIDIKENAEVSKEPETKRIQKTKAPAKRTVARTQKSASKAVKKPTTKRTVSGRKTTTQVKKTEGASQNKSIKKTETEN